MRIIFTTWRRCKINSVSTSFCSVIGKTHENSFFLWQARRGIIGYSTFLKGILEKDLPKCFIFIPKFFFYFFPFKMVFGNMVNGVSFDGRGMIGIYNVTNHWCFTDMFKLPNGSVIVAKRFLFHKAPMVLWSCNKRNICSNPRWFWCRWVFSLECSTICLQNLFRCDRKRFALLAFATDSLWNVIYQRSILVFWTQFLKEPAIFFENKVKAH
jgi:hypothetical protein